MTKKDPKPASHWNYRVVRTKEGDEYVFDVREFYYENGQIAAWSRDPIAPGGESWHELADDLVKMQRAVSEPIIDLTGDKPREMSGKERAHSRVNPPGSEAGE